MEWRADVRTDRIDNVRSRHFGIRQRILWFRVRRVRVGLRELRFRVGSYCSHVGSYLPSIALAVTSPIRREETLTAYSGVLRFTLCQYCRFQCIRQAHTRPLGTKAARHPKCK